jgi:NAD(P)-dependent dehydrogenase (short-subunit alcohol dehydrogenase family)
MPVAFLTGGGRGIGAATKDLLLAQGWGCIAPTRQDCDLQSYSVTAAYAQALTQHGPPLRAVILNAHAWYSAPLETQTPGDFDTQMAYVRHHWWLLRHLLLYGHVETVITVASTRGLMGGVASGPYSMAKAALVAMHHGFVREWPSVRFHCVCPGLTATEMEAVVRATGGASPGAVAQPPQAVAQVIVDLLHAEGTGQLLRVVNGLTTSVAWKEC